MFSIYTSVNSSTDKTLPADGYSNVSEEPMDIDMVSLEPTTKPGEHEKNEGKACKTVLAHSSISLSINLM